MLNKGLGPLLRSSPAWLGLGAGPRRPPPAEREGWPSVTLLGTISWCWSCRNIQNVRSRHSFFPDFMVDSLWLIDRSHLEHLHSILCGCTGKNRRSYVSAEMETGTWTQKHFARMSVWENMNRQGNRFPQNTGAPFILWPSVRFVSVTLLPRFRDSAVTLFVALLPGDGDRGEQCLFLFQFFMFLWKIQPRARQHKSSASRIII